MGEYEVSIVMPVYNEEQYIVKCVESILLQDFDKEKLEVVFVDGCSTDKTAEILNEFTKKHSFIKVYQNPYKTVQYALNIGIKNALGEYIVRMDAHSEYAADYVSKCLQFLKETDAVNVGGPMIAKGKTSMQKVIAAAYHSSFALGGGKFHEENFCGYADTVYLGSYKRETIIEYGLYDENFPRSEDDELNLRITQNGGKIFISPEIKSVYYPRASIKALFSQYYEYGLWKPAVIKKHKKPARLSHLIPVLFVLFLSLGFIASFFNLLTAIGYSSILSLYLLMDIYFSFKNKYISGFTNKLILVFVHAVLHVSYGIGFLFGIFKFMIFNKKKI